MDTSFNALVLTYKNAPLEVREMVSLDEGNAKRLLEFLKDCTAATDLMVISTCNRTEVYFNAHADISPEVFSGLRLIKKLDAPVEGYFDLLPGPRAIRHLFEVAIGLDAQIMGDLQVSGQVKSAYQWSVDANTAGPYLHRLMHSVFYTHKRVVQETAFRDGAASLSYAAKELAEELTTGITSPRIVVVGVGEIGNDVCLNLSNSALRNVTIINRTAAKAERLATACGFSWAPIEELNKHLSTADVAIVSISGTQPLITKPMVTPTVHAHRFIIDLSIPRAVDTRVEEMPGIVLYNLDDLREKTSQTVERRRAALPKVNEIIEKSIHDFEDWSREMIVSPAIQKIKGALEQIRQEELARYLKNCTAEEARKMDELSKKLIQKVVKLPVLQLKAACKRGEAETLVEVLQELFDLEKLSRKKK